MPSISPCRRICSTSDFKMGSSPTTQITSSTMLCSGIMAFLVATLSAFWRVCCACCWALAETPINKRVPMKPAMYFAPLFFIAFSICLFFIISLFNRFFLIGRRSPQRHISGAVASAMPVAVALDSRPLPTSMRREMRAEP